MLYDVKTPEEYIERLENDWRKETLQEIREIIKSHAPHFTEKIEYKMLGYTDKNDLVFSLNAQKNYVSFYIGDAQKVDPYGRLLSNLDRGKGCIRFKKSTVVKGTHISEFIKRAVEMRERGEDIDC